MLILFFQIDYLCMAMVHINIGTGVEARGGGGATLRPIGLLRVIVFKNHHANIYFKASKNATFHI